MFKDWEISFLVLFHWIVSNNYFFSTFINFVKLEFKVKMQRMNNQSSYKWLLKIQIIFLKFFWSNYQIIKNDLKYL